MDFDTIVVNGFGIFHGYSVIPRHEILAITYEPLINGTYISRIHGKPYLIENCNLVKVLFEELGQTANVIQSASSSAKIDL